MDALFDGLPDFLGFGASTTRVIQPLFSAFNDDRVAPALALFILLVALALCALFLINSFYIRAQVRRRIRAVNRIKDKADFAEALPQVERLMLSSRYLRHSWQKLRATLVFIEVPSDQPAGNMPVYNTVRPQTYFNIAEARLRFPLYRAMPNLLVGVGLLLTFIGLVTALYWTNEAIKDASNLQASRDALRDLLHAAALKFYTSIAGLGGSMILTLVLRYGTSKLEASFDALAFALERKLVLLTPESIAFAHYREAQEQTRNLELFNTEVAISISRRIEEVLASLPAYLSRAMAPISKSLDEAVGRLSAMNEGAIGQLAGNFADRLQGATGEHMNRMAETLADLRTSLDGMNRRMEESGSGLVENIGRSVEDMRTAISTMTVALGEMASLASQRVDDGGAAMMRQIEHATESLDIISRQIYDVLNQVTDSFQAASERSAVQIEEAVGTITRGLEVQSAGIGERVAAAAIAASEESRIKVIDAGSDLAHMLSGIGQQLTDASTRMHDSLNRVVHEMNGIERSIGQHVAVIGQLSKATQETETAMQNTARSMREAGAPLAETSRQIAEATRRISQSAQPTENLGVVLNFAKDED